MAEILGLEIALLIVTISIILSGILIGTGRAFSIKKIEFFGIEELLQSILNAALIGGIVLLIETIETISKETVTLYCSSESLIKETICSFTLLSEHLFYFFQELLSLNLLLGYYQSLVLDFTAFQIQPLQNLNAISSIFSSHLFITNILIILLNFNIHILTFFLENSIALFLPLGLVFRSFFATRKLGGFLVALSIGFYIFYPAFISIFPVPIEDIQSATSNITMITNNSNYAAIPLLDLNDNHVIAEKLDNMTNSSFVGNLVITEQATSKALSDVLFYSIFSPIFSLLLTLIFVRELGKILGENMSFSWGVV
ncbi:MAG: hypothetical protein PHU63_03980 [Candidatus ainarchaeum sp.]|nr:hypothetical protein [Candidatus ainarchaeum sp.]